MNQRFAPQPPHPFILTVAGIRGPSRPPAGVWGRSEPPKGGSERLPAMLGIHDKKPPNDPIVRPPSRSLFGGANGPGPIEERSVMSDSTKKPRILLVDDQPVNLRLLEVTLNREYHVSLASNGWDALRVAATTRPNLILLDIMMPEMDGYAVCEQLKSDPELKTIPVIFLTSRDSEQDESHGFALGGADYITKPFRPAVVAIRVRNQLELQRHRQDLQALVDARTRELRAAMEAADAGNRAKNSFLEILSQEVFDPLHQINGFSLLLANPALDDQSRREFSEIVANAGAGLQKMFQEVFDMVQMEGEGLRLEPVPLSIPELVRQVITSLAENAAKKGVTLAIDLHPDIPAELCGDYRRLYKVLEHLLDNAVKFMDQGNVRLRVAKESTNAPWCLLRFSVADDGAGIAAEKQAMIFDYFTQVENPITRRHKGIGLGLAICKQFVALMGGRIWMESSAGQGTVFHFTARFKMPSETAEELFRPRNILPD